jgi:serine protease
VVFKKGQVGVAALSMGGSGRQAVQKVMGDIAGRHALKPATKTFSVAIQGGVYELDEAQAAELANDPAVDYVEKDEAVRISTSQAGATWGLDRIDQSDLPLNQTYNYQAGGAQVNAYIIDTGINLTHQDFAGRAVSAIDIVDNDSDATDCNGHGTHVAGTIGSNTYGVAKNVRLYGVRVLDCFGSGSFSDVVEGIEWVTAHHVKPAVANMSLGGPVSQAIDDAVNAAVAAGVTFVVAAGNENANACNGSPARVPAAITVGATDSADNRASYSNYGSCVDIFAPGTDITSLWYDSSTATQTISGTSMASPHVAGVVALYLAQHPNALPAEVSSEVVAGAVNGKVKTPGSASPNKLLNIAFIDGSGGGGSGGGDNGGGGSPVDSKLKNGEAVGGLAGAKDDERFFTVEVPAGAKNLVIEISGGQGDADLYVKSGSKPSASSYDCRPYRSGNAEQCTFASPSAGVYHVMLKAYAAYSAVSLKASFQPASGGGGSGAPCTACDRFSGNLSGKGALEYQPAEYQAGAGQQQFWLSGPSGTDFDIYLYKKSGSSWSEVAKSVKLNSSEQISYQGSAGTYRLKVVSYAGSGAYELWRKLP